MARVLLVLLAILLAGSASADVADRLFDAQKASYHREQLDLLARGTETRARVEAAGWLADQGAPEDIAALGRALSDQDPRVRRAAASGLWKLEERAAPAKPQLLQALDDPDPNVAARAAGALQSLGMKEAELAPARRRVLGHAEAATDTRFLVARELVGLEPAPRLVRPMLDFLDEWGRVPASGRVTPAAEKNVQLADKALEKLVTRSRDRALVAPLVEALEAGRGGAVVLLQTLALFAPPPEGWAPLLVRQLDSPNPKVRYAALDQLRRVKGEADIAAFVPRVTQVLDDRDSLVRSEALWVLGDAGGLATPALPRIERALNDEDESVRNNAAKAIAAIRASQPNFAAASPRQSDGKAVLRARKVDYDEGAFFTALSQVDVELVRAFLDAGMSPRDGVAGMGPPLRVMLFAGAACAPNERPTKPVTLQAAKLLLERGADPNGADARGNTALMEAAGKGCDREVVRVLLRAGARVDAKNAAGLTPFELGLFSGSDGLEELIAAGYRLPPEKARMYAEGYKDKPAVLALIRKASAVPRK